MKIRKPKIPRPNSSTWRNTAGWEEVKPLPPPIKIKKIRVK